MVQQDTHGLAGYTWSCKIHMVPALINDDYVIRFAVCAQHAVDDDVVFAWNVISEMATDVLAMCDTNKETETLKEFHRIESLEVSSTVGGLVVAIVRLKRLSVRLMHLYPTECITSLATLSRSLS